jgi:N-acetylmuramoyl-L-alanine amidase
VVIGLRPSVGWRIREDTRSEPQQLYVQLYQPQNVAQSGTEPNFDPPRPNPLPPRAIPPRIRPIVPPANITNRGRGVIVVDPGHGGNDVGAVGNGIYESNVVLAISLKLGRILQEMGYTVVYTRTDNTEVELQPRVD